MDYSQFQVKYIKNPEVQSSVPKILEDSLPKFIPDLSNIRYLNAEADSPTSIIVLLEETPKVNPVKKVIKLKPSYKLPDLKPSLRLTLFNFNYDLAIKNADRALGQLLAQRRNLFTRLAYLESGLRHHIANSRGVPAFGYFQFMLGNYRGKNYNNVKQFAKVDTDAFILSPVILILAANNLANWFMRNFSKTELLRLHLMGYSDSAIIAGAWLGGPGGVRSFAFNNNNRKDVNGTSVGKYMQMFNNL